ncbi:MAG: hypothetical protein JNM39_16375 [Bdellovibrionaceae bacterium]|nr:hypothetical protein [Pseudobdellovibrionaceae bacterium]
MKIAKAEVSSLDELPPKTQQTVLRETKSILTAWKRTVDGIIQVGKSLEAIREALPSALYVAHIKRHLGLNPMQASRFISVHRRFGNAQSAKVLQTKVSVLYLLATAPDLEKVERLANGGTVFVSGQRKSISDLKVEDAAKIRKGAKPVAVVEPTAAQMDRQRCAIAYQELGDLTQDIQSWSIDLVRFRKKGMEIKNQKLLSDTLKECKAAIGDCISALR